MLEKWRTELSVLDPREDRRWSDFLQRNPQASVFHTPAWSSALSQTYRYRPFVFTSAQAGQPLADGLICCEINSWLTGKRLVSLPFSDHCQPLAETASRLRELLAKVRRSAAREGYRFLELRPQAPLPEPLEGFAASESHWLHHLDLDGTREALFSRLHPSCIQRKIRRAAKEDFRCEVGNGAKALDAFYRLQVRTRRRHGLPPQPRAWFQNLAESLGSSLRIHLAKRGEEVAAAVVTLRFKRTLVYKYGCSDPRWHPAGVVPWLLWQAILHGLETGCQDFDMGRTESSNHGLKVFKERWNATPTWIQYLRAPQPDRRRGWLREKSKPLWRLLPDRLLETAGGLLYRHFG